MDVTVPKLAWPLAITNAGHFAVREQDSLEEIEQCVGVIARVERGEISDIPEFGLRSRVLTRNDSTQIADLATEVRAIEPRADIDVTGSYGRISTDRFIDITVGRAA